MNKTIKYSLFTLSVFAVLSVIFYISIWIDDASAKKNKERVYALIKVGQNLNGAEQKLKESGFNLLYSVAIKPTYKKDYLQQIVIVGETTPNVFESFAYASQLQWIPFVHSESPYVIINATLDGRILEIK